MAQKRKIEKIRKKNQNGGRVSRESSVRVARAGDAARGGLVARRHAPVDPAGSEGGPRRRAALPRTTEPRARRRSGKALTDNSIFAPRREPRGPQLDPATVQARGESFPHGPGRRAPLPTPSGPRPRLSPRPHLLVEVSSHVRPLRATREGGEDATLSSTSGGSPQGPGGGNGPYRTRARAQGVSFSASPRGRRRTRVAARGAVCGNFVAGATKRFDPAPVATTAGATTARSTRPSAASPRSRQCRPARWCWSSWASW